jgi:hypothetical protein
MSLDNTLNIPDQTVTPCGEDRNPFWEYLRAALAAVLADEADGSDGCELEGIHRLCRRSILENWSALTPATFIHGYLWCVGSSRKNYGVRLKQWDDQLRLFRQGDAARIARDEIREKWARRKCYLSPDMVESVIEAATKIFVAGWEGFRNKWLLLPADPESEQGEDWRGVHSQFCKFWEVGDAIAWYLVRNLYGGRFFKPDEHIKAIARHFLGEREDPIAAMRTEAIHGWPSVCQDRRFLPLHLGELDHILWWHKRKNGLPG